MKNDDQKTVNTICYICNGACGITLEISGGVVTGVRGDKDHPLTRGYICPKGKAIPEIVHAPDRLTKPLRKDASGEWREVSWDEAFDLIADKLTKIKAEHGPEALAIHVGQTGVRKEFPHYVERFAAAYGTPNCSAAGSHCHQSKRMANEITYGVLPSSDYANSNCIVLWGYNPAVVCPPQANDIARARARGAKLIVIDPLATPLARAADIHLQPRPGTDGALALGMLQVIIGEELYDKEFVANWTVGFEQLAELVKAYPPEAVEKITWVPAAKIAEAARLLALTSPANISAGNSVELQTNGFQAIRATAILQAITGNLDIAGGAVFLPPAKLSSLELSRSLPEGKPAIGQQEFPLFLKYTKRAQANIMYKAILDGTPYPLKGMIVDGSNPVLIWPNAGKVKEALSKLEFLVVIDHFMTETARQADLVIPATTFLGRHDLNDAASIYTTPRLFLSDQVLDEEGISDWQFWIELARRLGFNEEFPWATEVEAIDFRLKPLGVTYDQLKQDRSFVYAAKRERKYEKAGFKTPSGKVEIYSPELAAHGYDPLPVYREPAESPISAPRLAEEYPLILSTGARTIGYYHSRYRNIPSLRRLMPDPLVWVHPDTAARLGVADGDWVDVESSRGAIELRVSVIPALDPRVIYALHGWDSANSNLLTDSEVLDPVTGFPADRSFLARIVKKDGK